MTKMMVGESTPVEKATQPKYEKFSTKQKGVCKVIPPTDFDTTPREHFPATEMRCSICQSPLVAGGCFKREDACSMVYTDFKYTCPNHPLIFFGSDGEIFSDEYNQYPYINGLRSAFGSFARRVEVEIHKHDEEKFYHLTKRWTLLIYYDYKSNENGDILKRKRRFRFLKDHCYHTFDITILYHAIRDVHKGVWQHFFHNLVSRACEGIFMRDWFGVHILNRRWSYRFHKWYGRVWMRILRYGPGWEGLK